MLPAKAEPVSEGAVRFVERQSGESLSAELDPETAAVVDALLQLGPVAVRLVSSGGRWLDRSGREWVPENHRWHPLRRAA